MMQAPASYVDGQPADAQAQTSNKTKMTFYVCVWHCRHVEALFNMMQAPASYVDGQPADAQTLQVRNSCCALCLLALLC